MRSLISVAVLSFALGLGGALAQSPPPDSDTTSPPPATSPAPKSSTSPKGSPKLTSDQKKAISKSCSDQADQKDLHGKARKKFRAKCIKAGGNPPPQ
jgi:hypothetical protein